MSDLESLIRLLELHHIDAELSNDNKPADLIDDDEVYDLELESMEIKLRETEETAAALEKEIVRSIEDLSEIPRRSASFVTCSTYPTDNEEIEEEEYIVTQILGKKGSHLSGTIWYLCVWSGGGGISWEEDSTLECVNLIETYEELIKQKWLEILEKHHEKSRTKFLTRTNARGWTFKPVNSARRTKREERRAQKPTNQTNNNTTTNYYNNTYYSNTSNTGISSNEESRLMHLDIPALKRYLQSVVEFTPLHYQLLCRLSAEDSVSRGASQWALDRIRSATLEEQGSLEPGATCSICLDEHEYPVILPCCHLFHRQCIENWLGSEKHCPLCKTEL